MQPATADKLQQMLRILVDEYVVQIISRDDVCRDHKYRQATNPNIRGSKVLETAFPLNARVQRQYEDGVIGNGGR